MTIQISDFLAYTKIRNFATEAVYSFENNLALNIKSDPKKFWKYVNSSNKVEQGIPMLE